MPEHWETIYYTTKSPLLKHPFSAMLKKFKIFNHKTVFFPTGNWNSIYLLLSGQNINLISFNFLTDCL